MVPAAPIAHRRYSRAATGLIKAEYSEKCGDVGATEKTNATAGPNGRIEWMNCGIDGGGWSPPLVKVSDIVAMDLDEALQSKDSPFQACKNYVGLFKKHAADNGLQPIMLAAFAMQESSCNPKTQGEGGEQGLMQITKDKCGGAPNGDCKDPDFNIGAGASYFKGVLDSNKGDLLRSLGNYNGWSVGMTHAKATGARKTSCCRCQNNLDYLHQFLNGWIQNINVYEHVPRIGKYFNLDVCDK
ncbi:glycoside hydrolase family 23 protein [Mycena floridula]|nr:glycoside hydrolase family 23 protein [Mycena floridula]